MPPSFAFSFYRQVERLHYEIMCIHCTYRALGLLGLGGLLSLLIIVIRVSKHGVAATWKTSINIEKYNNIGLVIKPDATSVGE